MKLEEELRLIFEDAGRTWKINGEKITPLPSDIRSVIERAKKELQESGGSLWVDGLIVQTDGPGQPYNIYAQIGEEDG